MNKYLELNGKEGRFFEYSKEPKEGFEKHTKESGDVSYRKTYEKGAIGKLKYINEKEDDFGKGKVKSAVLVVEDENNDNLYLKVPVMNSKGSLNEYFEDLATLLPNLKVGETYRVYPYSMDTTYTNKTGEVKPTTNRGFSISTYDVANDVKLVKIERAHKYGEGGDIPDVIWTPETDMGVTKNVKNDKEKRNFLYNSFLKTVSPQGTPTNTAAPAAPKQEPKVIKEGEQPKPNPGTFVEEEHDDLTF